MNKLQFYAKHGAYPEEKSLGQLILIDLEFLYEAAGNKTDQLSDTVDYTAVYENVKEVTLNNSFNLMEKLAEEIIFSVMNNFPVSEVCVKIAKRPAYPGISEVEFELRRNR